MAKCSSLKFNHWTESHNKTYIVFHLLIKISLAAWSTFTLHFFRLRLTFVIELEILSKTAIPFKPELQWILVWKFNCLTQKYFTWYIFKGLCLLHWCSLSLCWSTSNSNHMFKFIWHFLAIEFCFFLIDSFRAYYPPSYKW